jgi:hypothetical protein
MRTHTTYFDLGNIVATRGVAERMQSNSDFAAFVAQSLARHSLGDWGDVCKEDWKTNDDAVTHGNRLLSSYGKNTDDHLWFITEWDRSVTTALFPDEY